MERAEGNEPKPAPDQETKEVPLPRVDETADLVALDPSDDPVALVASPAFPVAFRGYDRRVVDDYVRDVAQLVAELHASRSPRAAVKRALDRVGTETAAILQRARESADETIAQARARTDERLAEAEAEAQRVRAEADAHVRALDAATDEIWRDRRRIVDDTRRLGERLRQIADEAAERFPAEGDDGASLKPGAEAKPRGEAKPPPEAKPGVEAKPKPGVEPRPPGHKPESPPTQPIQSVDTPPAAKGSNKG